MIQAAFHPLILTMLPRTQRIFLKLWAERGLTFEEIADIYGASDDEVEEVINMAVERYDDLTARPRIAVGGREKILPLVR